MASAIVISVPALVTHNRKLLRRRQKRSFPKLEINSMKAIASITTALALSVASAFAQQTTGNGALSGAHYNLNIIGKTQCSPSSMTDSSRHTIQVLLNGGDSATSLNGSLASNISKVNKIYLAEGDFAVLDGNGCDRDGAKFRLPAGGYAILARALGKPGGVATMTTCATGAGADGILGTADDEIVCSTENAVLTRKSGKSTFSNVTKELTSMVLDTDGDGNGDTRVSIFDPSMQDYFWNYDNKGLRLAQLRFYMMN